MQPHRDELTDECRSGALNAKHRELAALQAQARARLVSSRANFADGMKAAREVRADLEWTGKRVAYVLSPLKRKTLRTES